MAVPNQTREAAFTRIVAEHARFLYRVAHSVLRHPQDAEDAVQDERAFLARVVWRTALDRIRMRPAAAEDEGAELRLSDARPTPESAAAESDERALLHELIEALPLDLREPLLLSAIEELNSREVGLMLGLPEGTVRTRLMRARTELRARFEARALNQVAVAGIGRRR